MDGNYNEKVVCCFCNKELLLTEASILIIQPSINSEESQTLFCHKNHLVEKIDKSIFLHPDFFDDDDE